MAHHAESLDRITDPAPASAGDSAWTQKFLTSDQNFTRSTNSINPDASAPLVRPQFDSNGKLEVTPLDYGTQYAALAKPRHKSARDSGDTATDAFQTNADRFDRDELVTYAKNKASNGADLTQPPARLGLDAVPKKFGCVSSLSNIFQATGEFKRNEFPVSVDDLEAMLPGKGWVKVPISKVQDGDIVVGRGENDGSGGRHVGIADVGSNGKVSVYNNHAGTFSKDSLKDRFTDRYSQVYAWHKS